MEHIWLVELLESHNYLTSDEFWMTFFYRIWKCMPLNMEFFVENGFFANFGLRWCTAPQKYSRYSSHFSLCTTYRYFQRVSYLKRLFLIFQWKARFLLNFSRKNTEAVVHLKKKTAKNKAVGRNEYSFNTSEYLLIANF